MMRPSVLWRRGSMNATYNDLKTKVRSVARIVAEKKDAPKRSSVGGKMGSLAPQGGAVEKATVRKAAAKKTARLSMTVKKGMVRKPVVRKMIARKVAIHILSAPRGARTLSHRKIKQAVERVFVERYGIDA